jgi:ion channel
MPRWQRTSWNSVLRLTGVLTAVSIFIVLTSGSALWLVEGDRPDSTLRSWGDALWWSLSTITTVGYGDHVPVTPAGRLIATAVMVAGVAIIGAVAAIVALAMALHITLEEERTFEAEAETLERRVEVRLAGIEAQLADLDTYLKASQHTSVNDSVAVATRAVARSSSTPFSSSYRRSIGEENMRDGRHGVMPMTKARWCWSNRWRRRIMAGAS